jgi:hypothetical protein
LGLFSDRLQQALRFYLCYLLILDYWSLQQLWYYFPNCVFFILTHSAYLRALWEETGTRGAEKTLEPTISETEVKGASSDVACEQALKVNWEPASMTSEFEYLRLKSWREILIGQML